MLCSWPGFASREEPTIARVSMRAQHTGHELFFPTTAHPMTQNP